MTTLPVDFRERQYISQYSPDILGLAIMKAGVPADADAGMVLNFIREDPETPETLFTRAATHVGTGLYEVTLTAEEASVPGYYTLLWEYALDTVEQRYYAYAEIGQSAPAYDALSAPFKDVVDSVWIRFADLFDSPAGGPHLMTYFQTHFGRGRIAQMMAIGLGRLNTMAQPHMTYTLTEQNSFPVDQWGPLLETMTYIETLKHLIRSYVEQPLFMGSGAVTRLDRRDYLDRWQSVLTSEEEMVQKQLEVFKIAHLGLGRPRVLVSGGVYGRYGPTRVAGSIAARPRYWTRWY